MGRFRGVFRRVRGEVGGGDGVITGVVGDRGMGGGGRLFW